jgi:hypothetical protein
VNNRLLALAYAMPLVQRSHLTVTAVHSKLRVTFVYATERGPAAVPSGRRIRQQAE